MVALGQIMHAIHFVLGAFQIFLSTYKKEEEEEEEEEEEGKKKVL